jgi:2-amino-4-hydroxy-6-hydroxymethyldihydropteridine diphosphokinase
MADVYISFGSNIGDRFAHINQALHLLLEADSVTLMQLSSLYETEPVGDKNQDWFLNGVLAIETHLLPHPLLDFLKTIEKRIGREHRSRWGPREIDLDLLILGSQCVDTPDLTVPHPEIHRRRFVLVPFVEIAPDVVHPILGKKVHTLLSELTGAEIVRRVAPPPIELLMGRTSVRARYNPQIR